MREIATIARDIYRLQVQHIEEFAAAYFQKTHLDPREAKLVSRQTLTDTGVKLEYWFEPFPSESEIEIYRKRADLAEAATSLALVENSKTIKQLNEAERELAELKERTRWIPVSERLPEVIEQVLCYAPHYHSIEIRWTDQLGEAVTHWQLLPYPPESENE